MHCASCELLIERKFKEIPGVHKVRVNHATGKCKLYCVRVPELSEFNRHISADGYSASWWGTDSASERAPEVIDTKRHYIEIGIIFFVVVVAYIILRGFNIVPKIAITSNMSYGVVFLIGLVAALSTCIAVTGGLLLSVAAKYNEMHPGLSGVQRFKPHIYFNVGRVVSYTVLGGAVGALGSVVTLSPYANGILTIIASIVMILLGFQLLKLFPKFRRLQPRMPKFLGSRIHNLASSENRFASFALGAGTFFLPCGFTQALQLYVLSQGGFWQGALTMLVFSLGTLPALVSLGAISSFAKGAFQRYFLKFAGVIVIFVGVFSIKNGLALTGVSASISDARSQKAAVAQGVDQAVPIVDGKQIAEMKIVGLRYEPAQFTVVKGVPVEWRIDASDAAGCAAVVSAPSLGINKYVNQAETLSFTPDTLGTQPFSCSMGMTTRGAAFTVIENPTAAVEQTAKPTQVAAEPIGPSPAATKVVEPKKPEPEVQKITLKYTASNGFTPKTLEVKKDIPVEFTVDTEVQLSGCMSTLVIPEFGISQYLELGKNVFNFTPTEPGTIGVICPMGVPMTQILVS